MKTLTLSLKKKWIETIDKLKQTKWMDNRGGEQRRKNLSGGLAA